MTEPRLDLPEACRAALEAIQADPLTLPPAARAHLRTCPSCAEARVQWLALEEAPAALAPAGYFERLPARILRKLPARRGSRRVHPALWAAAAALMLGLGVGGFLLGRIHRAPVVEATLPRTPAELKEVAPDTPFLEADDGVTQLRQLTPEEAEAVLKRLESAPANQP